MLAADSSAVMMTRTYFLAHIPFRFGQPHNTPYNIIIDCGRIPLLPAHIYYSCGVPSLFSLRIRDIFRWPAACQCVFAVFWPADIKAGGRFKTFSACLISPLVGCAILARFLAMATAQHDAFSLHTTLLQSFSPLYFHIGLAAGFTFDTVTGYQE